MMTGQRQPPAELTIGVVGPHDLVERVMLSGAVTPGQALSVTGPGPARRLVAAAYGFIWIALLAYVVLLARGLGRVRKDLAELRGKVNQTFSEQADRGGPRP